MGMIRTLAFLGVLIMATPVLASAGFGTTFGTNANDIITLGTIPSYTTQVTYAFWFNMNAAGGFNSGRLLDCNADVMSISWSSTGNKFSLTVPFSTTAGKWDFATFSSANFHTWNSVVITYDGSATSNKPTMYLNGTSQTVNTDTTPVGAISSTSTCYLGNRISDHARNYDGVMADFAIWNNKLLTANEVKALSRGASALKIEPAALAFYMPLYAAGSTLNLNDWGPSRLSNTNSGAKAQPHAPTEPYPLMPR